MKRRYLIVGGLAALAALAVWLMSREPGRRVYFGPPSGIHDLSVCVRGESYGSGSKGRAWRCVEWDTVTVANLRVEVTDTDSDQRRVLMLVGVDGRDYYGVRYEDAADRFVVRALDREEAP